MSKNNNIEQFDNFFKENLENASVDAPSGVWENVASQVGSGAAGVGTTTSLLGKAALIKTVAVIAVVTVAAVGIIKLVQEDNKTELVKTEVALKNATEKISSEETVRIKDEIKESVFSKEEKVVIENKKLATANNDISSSPSTESNISISDPRVVENKENKGMPEIVVPSNNKDELSDLGLDVIEIKGSFTEDLKYQIEDSYCIGEKIHVTLPGGLNAQWFVNGRKISEGENFYYSFTRTGTVKLDVKGHTMPLFSASVKINGPNTNFNASEINDGEFILDPAEKNATYTWNFNNSNGYQATNESVFELKDYVRASIPITLIVKTEEGCIDSIRRNVPNKFVQKGNNPSIPTGFIPGTDGLNDKFVIDIKHETYFNLVVKNKKGDEVFASQDKNIQWDGKCNFTDCPLGGYTFSLIYKIEGSDELRFKNGTITLLKE